MFPLNAFAESVEGRRKDENSRIGGYREIAKVSELRKAL
jgi:hypothetical protein